MQVSFSSHPWRRSGRGKKRRGYCDYLSVRAYVLFTCRVREYMARDSKAKETEMNTKVTLPSWCNWYHAKVVLVSTQRFGVLSSSHSFQMYVIQFCPSFVLENLTGVTRGRADTVAQDVVRGGGEVRNNMKCEKVKEWQQVWESEGVVEGHAQRTEMRCSSMCYTFPVHVLGWWL